MTSPEKAPGPIRNHHVPGASFPLSTSPPPDSCAGQEYPAHLRDNRAGDERNGRSWRSPGVHLFLHCFQVNILDRQPASETPCVPAVATETRPQATFIPRDETKMGPENCDPPFPLGRRLLPDAESVPRRVPAACPHSSRAHSTANPGLAGPWVRHKLGVPIKPTRVVVPREKV
jgi:hypothetical protein